MIWSSKYTLFNFAFACLWKRLEKKKLLHYIYKVSNIEMFNSENSGINDL